jgi:hypothetical protein
MVCSLLTDGDNLNIRLKVEKLDPAAWELDVALVIFYCKCNLYYELCQKDCMNIHPLIFHQGERDGLGI